MSTVPVPSSSFHSSSPIIPSSVDPLVSQFNYHFRLQWSEEQFYSVRDYFYQLYEQETDCDNYAEQYENENDYDDENYYEENNNVVDKNELDEHSIKVLKQIVIEHQQQQQEKEILSAIKQIKKEQKKKK